MPAARIRLGAVTTLALTLGPVFTLIGPACVDCSPTGNCTENYRELGHQLHALAAIVPASLALGVATALTATADRPLPRRAALLGLVPAWLLTTAALLPFHPSTGDPPGPVIAALIALAYTLAQSLHLFIAALLRAAPWRWLAIVASAQLILGAWLLTRPDPACASQGLAQLPSTTIFGVDIAWPLLAACLLTLLVAATRPRATDVAPLA